jgi:type II secretory pathway pseudopilin PulG
VLLAVTIVAMLASIVAVSLQIAVQTWEKGEQQLARIERTRHLIEFLAEDIRAAFQFRSPFEVAGGGTTNVSAFFGDDQRINLITTAPLITATLPSTGLREVSYYVTPGKGLMMREAPLVFTDLYSDKRGVVLPIAPIVRDVKFEYLYQLYSRLTGELENEWQESWGSVEELSAATGIMARLAFTDEKVRSHSLRNLPAAVRVTLTIEVEARDGRTESERLDPIVIPIQAAQLYEAKRQL